MKSTVVVNLDSSLIICSRGQFDRLQRLEEEFIEAEELEV